ncbi:adenylate cyclase [Bradyrhizobium jicamae]|uniref:Adenylate cyclase n=1 Tax=Bradyrhizobium jicamae TaxID=280332 RepID=A0A0R3LES6_9BRAD|nr:adenylate/guanylate cyclase domain-containing protein [Bradyrhizobium jicamae]KRR06361.1 adenylate cyclase [Bradyrhizobium jicamae]
MVQERPVPVGRRLAAIVAADVAGYSRLMHDDEETTHAKLSALLADSVTPAIAEHGGRIVKNTGDGFLAEFPSAVEAVRAAVQFQSHVNEQSGEEVKDERIAFRVGINIGDVIVEAHDIFGDGVNIAARLEGIAEPGGICISSSAYDQVRGKVGVEFTDLGEQNLKNIARPVRVYSATRVGAGLPALAEAGNLPAPYSQPLPLPDKPSIAVLPFENMSGDPQQEYFADGMVEEIITALSRFKWLFVIARNSSFTFKGKAVDVKEVGRRLGVGYVLEGSVRKASGKVRITGQLIDEITGAHLWADRFERDLSDVFALQDEVTVAVISAIQPKLLQAEIALATRRRPENLTAYDFHLRAMQQYYQTTREGLAEAIRLAHRALELDPRFGLVAALAGSCHGLSVLLGYAADPQVERKEAVRLLRLALRIDDGDPETLAWAAMTSAFMVDDCEGAIELADRAVALNPNLYWAWNSRGWVYKVAGLSEEALRSFERAIRISPIDPLLHRALVGRGLAFIELGRFDEAIVAAKKAQRQSPSYSPTYRCLASAFAHLGRDADAREAAARVLETDPGFTISSWIARGGQLNSKLLIEGLRKARLPE